MQSIYHLSDKKEVSVHRTSDMGFNVLPYGFGEKRPLNGSSKSSK